MVDDQGREDEDCSLIKFGLIEMPTIHAISAGNWGDDSGLMAVQIKADQHVTLTIEGLKKPLSLSSC